MYRPAKFKPGVTVVITSYRRYDLLNKTLQSFFKFNTYPVEEIVIVEDGEYNTAMQDVISRYYNLT